jgi:xanthine dehydrogenase accessory factor
MRDLIADYERLLAGGASVGRAVITSVWGSAPRPEGACMLATRDGAMAGSVSGGCVENAALAEIAAAIDRGSAKLVTYGVSHEKAWEVGLACGGTIQVLVEPMVRPEVLAAARDNAGEVVATFLEGSEVRGSARVYADGRVESADTGAIPEARLREAALDALSRERSETVTLETATGSVSAFLEVFPRQPRLVIFGGVHIAMELMPLARKLGFRTIVADGREAWLTRERFPDADELILAWPEEAFERIGLDATCYVCLLTHDPKFDEPALRLALRSPAPYIGAIGSKKTQAERRERLRSEGFSPEEIARLHGPIGLQLGGREPAEIALAIVAEMTQVRRGGKAVRTSPAGPGHP